MRAFAFFRFLHRTAQQRRRRARATVERAPPFVTALLAKAVLSPTPSVTGGCPPATPTPAVTTHPSPRPSHPTPTQPNGGQQETTNRRSDLERTKAKYSHTTPPFEQQHSATQSTNKKTHAKRSKPTKGMYIIRKQTTNHYSFTKKMNTLAAAVRNISNVVCALQQQVCTLTTENVTLKTVIRNLKNQSTSSKRPPVCSTDPQVPAASQPASTRQTKKSEDLSEQQRARSSSKTPSTVYHQTTKTTQQRPETTNRPATSDLADSTSRRTAAAMPQRRATEDSRPAATSGHVNSTTRFTSSASGRAPGCPRRDQRPDRRLGGSSHQAGPGVPWGSEPEHQRLWPNHRRR